MKAAVLDVIVLRESEGAYLVDDGDQEVWVPKSVMLTDLSEYDFEEQSEFLEVEIAEWFALKAGMI